MIKKICKYCGKEFNTLPSEIKRGRGKYCSKECFYKDKTGKNRTTGNHKQVKVKCANCGKELIRKAYRTKGNNYCNSKCQMEYEYKNNIRDKFAITKKANKKVRLIGQPKLEGIPLSIEHKRKIRDKLKGENNYNWKGGVNTTYELIRKCFEYRQWRSDIFTRDGFACQMCGDNKGGNLIVHHIKPFIKILQYYEITTLEEAIKCEELWNINNGITYCEECHKKIHKQLRNKKLIAIK